MMDSGLRIRLIAALLSGMVLAVGARAEIYECVEADGSKRFTNVKAEAKGCKVLDIAPANVIPAQKPPQAKSERPTNFPKVDPQTQKQRDSDRRRILERELANEEQLLERARKELAEQEAIRLGSERNYQRVLDRLEPFQKKVKLHEDNVASLKKELANLK
jgi:hypothetical protein